MTEDQIDMSADTAAPQGEEQMVPRSTLAAAVSGERKRAIERGKQMAYEEMGRAPPQSQAPQPQAQSPQMTQEDISRMVEEHTQKALTKRAADDMQRKSEEHAQRFWGEFNQKLDGGRQKYADFDQVVDPIRGELANFPRVALGAHMADNTDDIIYDLAKNPTKLAQFEELAKTSPALANSAWRAYVGSVQQNSKAASNHKSAPEPLAPVTTSSARLDNGSMSIADLRALPEFRR